jgi:hypothetical protein
MYNFSFVDLLEKLGYFILAEFLWFIIGFVSGFLTPALINSILKFNIR